MELFIVQIRKVSAQESSQYPEREVANFGSRYGKNLYKFYIDDKESRPVAHGHVRASSIQSAKSYIAHRFKGHTVIFGSPPEY